MRGSASRCQRVLPGPPTPSPGSRFQRSPPSPRSAPLRFAGRGKRPLPHVLIAPHARTRATSRPITGPRSLSYSLVKQHMLLRSRGAFLRPGFACCGFAHPNEGWRSAEITLGCSGTRGRALTRHARRLARRLASLGRRSPLGAPPWRFWAPVPRFLLRHLLRIRAASSSQPGRSARRTGSRGLPVPTVTSRLRRDATPRSIFGIVSGDAPHE